jgi:hypothetical protein
LDHQQRVSGFTGFIAPLWKSMRRLAARRDPLDKLRAASITSPKLSFRPRASRKCARRNNGWRAPMVETGRRFKR